MQTAASAAPRLADAGKRITERDILLAAAGTLSALVYYRLFPPAVTGGAEPWSVAQSLLRNGTFANPFDQAMTGPTAHLAPLLPFQLALFIRWFGNLGIPAMFACMFLAHGIHAALLPRVSQALLGRLQPGLIAAVIAIALPIFKIEPVWENMYSAAAIVAFCLLARRLRGAADGLWSGLAAGLLLLLNPSLLTIVGCWLVYSLWIGWPGVRGFWRFGVGFAAACLLVILPWEVRNYRELGGITFIRDNLGLELYAANNDCAQPTLAENLANGCQKRMHPISSATEVAEVARLGELAYNRDRQHQAVQWMASHPQRFAYLLSGRFLFFWFPSGSIWIEVVTGLSLVGLGLALGQRQKMAWFAAAVFVLYPLTYYMVQASVRFRYPILWLSLLLAGYLLDRVYTAFRPSHKMWRSAHEDRAERQPAGSDRPS